MRTKPVTPMLAPEKGAVWSKFTKNKEHGGRQPSALGTGCHTGSETPVGLP